jgi:endonuclease YncB( thermonuclease family)
VHASPWLPLLLIATTHALAGCSDGATPTPIEDAGTIDAGAAMDVPAVDQGPPVLDSGCPAPQAVTPSSVPSGFLAPISMFYVRTVDGDTAHFRYMGVENTVRFLWVNTEEAHARPASKNTAFGIQTAETVTGYLGAGRAFTVVRQASATMPTMPALDTFDRTLALVFVDGELFQLRLVREGLSAYYTDFGCAPEPIHSSLLFAEAEARANRRGIWAPGHPTNYADVLTRWIGTGTRACRPNPFRNQSYCP